VLWIYLFGLLITIGIEVPVVAAVFQGQRLRMAVVCGVATTATHLAMHFLLPHVVGSMDQFMLLGELGALVVEALVYAVVSRPRDPGRALVAAALANGLSYGAGLLLIAA
jgi:hypothetical protein